MKAGWRTAKLTDVAELSGRIGWKGLTAKEYTQSGPYFLSVHSLNHGDFVDFRDAFHISQARYDESPEIMLQTGDVLICKDGAGIGKVGIVGDLPGQATINSSLLLIRAASKIEPKYLYYILMSPYFQAIVQSRLEGATTPHLYQRDIAGFPIHLPPIEEQRWIVAVLDKAFAAIATATANAQKNLTNARAVFDSCLASIFAKAAGSSQLVPLSELATDITDGDHSPPPKAESGVPFITIGNIDKRSRKIIFERSFRVSPRYFSALKANRKPRKGDVLYTVTGSFGIPVLVEDNVEFCFQRHIGLVRPKPTTDSQWLFYLLLSPRVFEQANSGATGAAQKTVSLKVLRSIMVPKIDLVDQRAAVIELDALAMEVDRIEVAYQKKLAALTELKQSLLQRAFTGELT